MKTARMYALAASTLILGASVLPAAAQDAKALVGTWTMVSNTITMPSGEKVQPFGSPLRGIMVLDANGRYVNTVMRPSLPRIAANSRDKGTPEENQAIVGGSISHFGRYKIDGEALVFTIESSTYPNWDGTTQKRPYTLNGDELKYSVPSASLGGTAEVVFRRAK